MIFRLLHRQADQFGSVRSGFVEVRVVSGASGPCGTLIMTDDEWSHFREAAVVAGFQIGPDVSIL